MVRFAFDDLEFDELEFLQAAMGNKSTSQRLKYANALIVVFCLVIDMVSSSFGGIWI
jgi:hypothetical protein